MHKNFLKKSLALVMALMMSFSAVPQTAFAADEPAQSAPQTTEEISEDVKETQPDVSENSAADQATDAEKDTQDTPENSETVSDGEKEAKESEGYLLNKEWRVDFQNLTPGKEYVLKGKVMDKATGKGIGVTAETRFTPEEADGSVIMEFEMDTNKLKGKTLVVFIEAYDTEGNLIAEHSDLKDKAQTVTVPNPVKRTPKTDDETSITLWLALMGLSVLHMVLSVLCAGTIIIVRRRKEQIE